MTSKKPVMTQAQMYYGALQQAADADRTFNDLVKGGMTRETLQQCIDHRPELWGRYSNWLEKLPQATQEALA